MPFSKYGNMPSVDISDFWIKKTSNSKEIPLVDCFFFSHSAPSCGALSREADVVQNSCFAGIVRGLYESHYLNRITKTKKLE